MPLTRILNTTAYRELQGHLFESRSPVDLRAGITALFAWLRNRKRHMLGWLALAMVLPFIRISNVRLCPDELVLAILYGLIGPMIVINDIASWFLLLYLLGLHDNAGLVRWTKILSVVGISLALFDSAMVCFDWTRLFQGRLPHRGRSFNYSRYFA